jgi:hypothetical protein
MPARRIRPIRLFVDQGILLAGLAGAALVLLWGCSRQRPTVLATASGPIECKLAARQTEGKVGRLRFVVEIRNSSMSNQFIAEPLDGSTLKYFYRRLSPAEETFHSLLLPMDRTSGPELVQLEAGRSVRHQSILGMDPGNYEIYVQYISRFHEPKNGIWLGEARSSGVLIHVPATSLKE